MYSYTQVDATLIQQIRVYVSMIVRWTINLVLRTIEKMFFLDSPFDSEDLAEVVESLLFNTNIHAHVPIK